MSHGIKGGKICHYEKSRLKGKRDYKEEIN